MSKYPTLSAIICTKNRATDLELTVGTVLRQSVLPHELVIVDQSAESSVSRIASLLRDGPAGDCRALSLHYIHDPQLPGLTSARNRAMDRASGEILLFLDDDVELEEDFLEELLATYVSHPGITGAAGVVTNYLPPSPLMRIWSRIFERGPFPDDRQPCYWKADELRSGGLCRVTRMGGGLMSLRRNAAAGVRFDERLRGVSDGEDVDFCMHLGPNAEMVINPRARLVHNRSGIGRLVDHWLRRYLRAQVYLYHRNWKHGVANRVLFGWLLFGSALVATQSSLRSLSTKPWQALVTGYQEGMAAAGYGSRS
jgi:GT2 family glycosyltransferase